MTRLPAGGDEEKALRPLFEKFLPVNHALRELCTAWQLRPDGTPNDHTDAAYDATVRDRLDDVDERDRTHPAPDVRGHPAARRTTARTSQPRWTGSTTATPAC